ncbi:uncharacterized protein MEPE_04240 [Melanopsichium pennsylvanicum]|uniref:Uncharacterized protein n=2 Tax=Melanopsichium pennsylvanicum TaxID=63383 RepID=A0AAJ5C683_9BASI|nr:putative protein [Melanopsichium pennsylvanicum 4]SNX85531.1 uncharacterized protein MEPE_04240 [Melanopsichium pennsylvanicum]
MGKVSDNGGPPSYDTASSSALTSHASGSAAAPSMSTYTPPPNPVMGSITNADTQQANVTHLNQPVDPTTLPRGVSLKEATNPSSMYNHIRKALDLPLITSTKRIPGPAPQYTPLPQLLLHCTLFASYDQLAPHPIPFCQVGCPATFTRGETGATSKSKVSQSVARLKRRFGVQIPLNYLGAPGFNPGLAGTSGPYSGLFAYLAHPQPKNGAEMTARSGNVGKYRRVSLFQAQAREMTAIISRPLVERVVSAIYAGQNITGKLAVFPAEAVLRYSNQGMDVDQEPSSSYDDGEQKMGFFSKLKAKAKLKGKEKVGDNRLSSFSGSYPIDQVRSADSVQEIDETHSGFGIKSVKTAMVFATIDLLAPPPRLLETHGPYPIEMNKASDADLSTSSRLIGEFDSGTDEQRFEKFLFSPNCADEQLCADMLRALERRGAIWTEAGRLITPSSRNPNPKERARFLVKGVFPERWVYRCKYYRGRKFEPMPNDLDAKEVKKFGSPLIVHQVVERTGNEGLDLNDHITQTSEAITRSSEREDGNDEPRLDWEWDQEHDLMFNALSTTRNDDTSNDKNHDEAAPPPDYVSTQTEMLKGYGIESVRARNLIEAENDFFQGWSIGVTEEPFKNGGFLDGMTASGGWYSSGGVIF